MILARHVAQKHFSSFSNFKVFVSLALANTRKTKAKNNGLEIGKQVSGGNCTSGLPKIRVSAKTDAFYQHKNNVNFLHRQWSTFLFNCDGFRKIHTFIK